MKFDLHLGKTSCLWLFFVAVGSGLVLTQSTWAAFPARETRIDLKSPQRTFNHINDYMITRGEKQIVFRKRNDPTSEWQKITFDSVKNSAPREIKADGANLMIRDWNDLIHYKKVLREKRRGEVYTYRDISQDSPWIERWFNLPVISLLHKIGEEQRLRLPERCRSWAPSHRGIYNRYFDNASNGKQYAFPMVTTVYAIPEDGIGVLFADPFIVGGFSHSIAGPDPKFRGNYLDAAASTILLMGELNGRPKLYYRLADFDTLGKNPFLPGFWMKRFAGPSEWTEVPLPQNTTLKYNSITLFQTEEQGNGAREIRIGGTQEGVQGYFRKKILENEWIFIPYTQQDT